MALAKPGSRGPTAPTVAAWTYAIYMDGDNSLETYWAGTSLPLLEAAPASASVNIVAFVDLGSTSGMTVQKISGTTVTTILTAPEMNMGNPATLTWCINQAAALFPSTYLVLSMWDHGYGWNYVCKDDTSGDSLSMQELQAGIASAAKKIDVLAFDCCNMGNIEVAYQVSLTNLVSYMVGSEETVPGNGFPYDKMLTKLVNNPAMLPRAFSIAMVDAWGEYYATQTWATTVNLAAIDVVQLKATISTFSTWSADMKSLLPGYKAAYATALKNAYYMWATHYFTDLYDYGLHLKVTKGVTDAKLKADTTTMQNAVSNYCIKVWDAKRMTDCKGISLYWGTGNEWSSHSAAYLQLAFAVDTGWGAFLTAYNA
ncbi:MAG: clostripain-related cysteine peptidase [Euryarchaeota archaeon]|nr:clostripain-related cysteine peptidase [Euryarchaeota archaeon]